MRAGTSSLFRYLEQHPQVNRPLRKEIDWFTWECQARPLRWYHAHFPLVSKTRERQEVTFEATPSYLLHPLAPRRVYAYNSGMRFIVLLRHPVERAISHHRHNVRHEVEMLPILPALQAEAGRLEPILSAVAAGAVGPRKTYERFSYVLRGRYHEQLLRWLEFFPRESMLVLEHSALDRDLDDVWVKIQDHLGLRRARLPRTGNLGSRDPHKGRPAPEAATKFIKEAVAADVARLAALVPHLPWVNDFRTD